MNPYRHTELAPTRDMIDWEREVRLREVGLLRSRDSLSALGDDVAARAMNDPATFKAQVRAQALRSLESQGPQSRVSVEAFDEESGRTYSSSW